MGISNYITPFNNFAKSTNSSTFPLQNYLYIIRNMITYNLGETMKHIIWIIIWFSTPHESFICLQNNILVMLSGLIILYRSVDHRKLVCGLSR